MGSNSRIYTLSPDIWKCSSSECILHILYDNGLLPIDNPTVVDEEETTKASVDKLLATPLATAFGDALGSTLEFAPLERKSKLALRSFPKGSHITDDTQLTYWGLEVLLRRGWLDPELVAERYSRERIIGIGSTVRRFLLNYKDLGLPWYHAAIESAGNGAVMKLAAALLSGYVNNGRLASETLLYTVVIYRDPLALASAYALAKTTWLLAAGNLSLEEGDKLLDTYIDFHRRVEGDRTRYRLETRDDVKVDTGWRHIEATITKALSRNWTPLEMTRRIGSSAYILETMLFTLYNIIQGGTPEAIIHRAATQSQDSDTIAAVTSMIIAAAKGLEALPQNLLSHFITSIMPKKYLIIQEELSKIITSLNID